MLPGRRHDRATLKRRRGRRVGFCVCSVLFCFSFIAWLYQEELTSSLTGAGFGSGSGSGWWGGGRRLDHDADLDPNLPQTEVERERASLDASLSGIKNADVESIDPAPGMKVVGIGMGEDKEQGTKPDGGMGEPEVAGESTESGKATSAVQLADPDPAQDSSKVQSAAGGATIALGVGSDAVSKLKAFQSSWADRPLPKAGSVQACAQELEAMDKVPEPRDFDKNPIRVYAAEIKSWKCGVPCEFARDDSKPFDASLGGGSKGLRVVRSMEAASYYGQNNVNAARKAGFDIVMTVHYDSDVPVQYGSWEEYKIMRPLEPKDPTVGIAAAFISNCAATNFRLQALEALEKHIKVDSYGRCHHNTGQGSVDKQETLMKYKFSLAFENSCEPDYVTEKFWQSLVAGAVPIVIGAPNIHQFAPNNHSFLQIKTIEDVPAVAEKVKAAAADEAMWKRMVEWKQAGPSDFFLANMDISTVHSSCRLCLFVADKIVSEAGSVERRSRPCRCQVSAEGSYVYHFYVRERFWFQYTSVYLESAQLSLEGLKDAIHTKFTEIGYQPVWAKKRPPSLATDEIVKALRIYRIYPSGLNQKVALQGDQWFQDDEQFLHHVAKNPCANLDVIFV